MIGQRRFPDARLILAWGIVLGLLAQSTVALPINIPSSSTYLARTTKGTATPARACCRAGNACCGRICCRPTRPPLPAPPALPHSNGAAEPRGLSLHVVLWDGVDTADHELGRLTLASHGPNLSDDATPVAQHIRLQI